MGKLTGALLLTFVIELALVLFAGNSDSSTSLYNVLMNPSNIIGTAFYLAVIALFVIGGAAIIVPGSIVQVNQWALYAVFATFVIGFSLNIAHLWSFISSQLASIMDPGVTCSIATFCTGWLIATMITAPLLVFYWIAVSEWARGN